MTLPLDTLVPWLRANVPGFDGPITAVTKFDVGQSNPTYRLDAPSGPLVLRCKPPGVLLKSAHAVDREFRVQRALYGTAVPVPKVHALCEDEAVAGAMFYVMDLAPGRSFVDPTMPSETPETRSTILTDMARVLAAIHDTDLTATGLEDYGPPGSYYDRQLARWTKQYTASETGALPDMDRLIARLSDEMPEDDGQRTLVHGDYRIDNMLFDGTTCTAVLDWELSTLGHPFADLAGVIMQWQLPPGEVGRGLAGVDRAALGLPTDDAFIAEYCARRSLPVPDRFGYYVAFAFFRMGAILQGVKKRALDGNASNPAKGLKLGEYVPVFAAKGLEALDG